MFNVFACVFCFFGCMLGILFMFSHICALGVSYDAFFFNLQ